MRLLQRQKVVHHIPSVDLFSNPQAGAFCTMKHYQHVTFLLNFGVGAASTPAITVEQALNVNGNGAKAVAFDEAWKQTSTLTGDQDDLWQRMVVSNNTFNGAANQLYGIEIRQDMLDIANDFDCVRLTVKGTNVGALRFGCIAIFSHGRYIGEGEKNMGFAAGSGGTGVN